MLLGHREVRHRRPISEAAQAARDTRDTRLPRRDCATIDGADILANLRLYGLGSELNNSDEAWRIKHRPPHCALVGTIRASSSKLPARGAG